MTHDPDRDHRHDDDAHDHDTRDHDTRDHDTRDHDTRVVDRQTYVERERPVEPDRYPAGGSQVNVNAGERYATTGHGVLYYTRRVLSLLFVILAVLIGLRILLLALVANEQNPIVDFIFGVTEPFVAPFRGMFQFDQVSPGGGSVLDLAAVVALIGWLLIYLLLMAILSLADRDRA